MAKTMAINAGSSSLKFQLFEMPAETVIAKGQVERIGFENAVFTLKFNDQNVRLTQTIANHEEAINLLLAQLKLTGIVDDLTDITGVGHRVVAGGEWFNQSVIVDDEVLHKIEQLADYAPLHNPANALGIRVFKKILPHALSVAVFDTAYHQTMPRKNYLYALPYEYYEKYGARKYGAHGTSHQYVAERAAVILNRPLSSLKLITLHLGAGDSITAIKNGVSVDTSMGFTPLSGIMMATRTGDVDPSLVYYLQEHEGLTNDEMLEVLNKKSGLLGVSGVSTDMRDLKAVLATNDRAKLAVEMFVDRVVRYIGQYYVELAGLDAIIFTAGIGENADHIRAMVIERLNFMGIKLDAQKNLQTDDELILSTDDSTVQVLKIATDEEIMIARDVQALQQANN